MLTKENQVEQMFTEQMPFETNQQANRVGTSWSDVTPYLWKAWHGTQMNVDASSGEKIPDQSEISERFYGF